MARFTKSRSRDPLAKGILSRSWGNDTTNGETFMLALQAEHTPTGKATFFTLKFDRNEAFTILKWLAPFLATPVKPDPYGMTERKDAAAALRELADRIEGTSEMNKPPRWHKDAPAPKRPCARSRQAA